MDSLTLHAKGEALAQDKEFQERVLALMTGHRFFAFARERMRLFHEKQAGGSPRSEEFPSMNVSRYTNPYRMLDRGSQFVVTEFANTERAWLDKMFRLYIYRQFNLVSTYYDVVTNVIDPFCYHAGIYGVEHVVSDAGLCARLTGEIIKFHDKRLDAGVSLYSRAYKRHTGDGFAGYFRYIPEMCAYVFPPMEEDESLADIFSRMRTYHGFGDFLSYQFALDVNYCRDPMLPIDFMLPGPGALRGIQYAVGSLKPAERVALIKVITTFQEELFVGFPYYVHTDGTEHLLEENDVQNLFCEFSKLENLENFGTKIGRRYGPSEAKPPMEIQLPRGI